MQTSEQINELATALAKAQGEITGALKDSANPFFKSKYDDLASCWDACREPLSKNGLSVVQLPARGKSVTIEWETTDQKTGAITQFKTDTEELVIVTTLFHSSGQWIKGELPMIPRDATPQGIGSAFTYGRRYALTALIGIAQVDDDGNAASGRSNGAHSEPHHPKGDVGKSIPEDQAMAEATAMRGILELDVEEHIKALKVFDRHDVLCRNEDLYVAASGCMSTKERAAWKAYVAQARAAQKADAASDPSGRVRRF